MVPPKQRFDAYHPPIGSTNDGLVFETKFMPLYGVSQILHQRVAEVSEFEGLLAHVDDLMARPSLSLDLVHGNVGFVQELFRIVPLTGKGNADTGRQLHD